MPRIAPVKHQNRDRLFMPQSAKSSCDKEYFALKRDLSTYLANLAIRTRITLWLCHHLCYLNYFMQVIAIKLTNRWVIFPF